MRRTNQVRQACPPVPPGRPGGALRQQEVSTNDQLFQTVQEMFEGKVEAEVVYMVLQEFDWNAEKAVDSLSVMCGTTLDPELKQSKLAKIAQDILCSEKKASHPTVNQSSQMLSPSDFPALTSYHQASTNEIRSSKQPTTKDTSSLTSMLSQISATADLSEKSSTTLTGNHKATKDHMIPGKENSSGQRSLVDKKGEGFWPNLGNPPPFEQRIGVIGGQRSRSNDGGSISPRNIDSNNRSQLSENSKVDKGPSPIVSQYNSVSNDVKSPEQCIGNFPSFHLESQKTKSDKKEADSKLQHSFDSIDDIDDDFEGDLEFSLQKNKKHHSSGTNDVMQNNAIGQSILSGALMLSDYSVPSHTENDSSLSNSPVENGNSCVDHAFSNINTMLEGNTHAKYTGTGYGNGTGMTKMWLKDNLSVSKTGTNSEPVLSVQSKIDFDIGSGRDIFKSPSFEVEQPLRGSPSPASRYSFANHSAGQQGRQDSVEYDDIENLLKKYKNENYSEDNKNKEKTKTAQDNLDVSTEEMKLPVLSFELSVEAKEFIPRDKKEDVKQNAEDAPKFFMPKMARNERPMPTSPPRAPLVPPGIHPSRSPFNISVPHWPPPPPPLNARLPFPGQMGRPPPPHFPGFHDPAMRGPYASMLMRPGQMMPPRKPLLRPPGVDKGIKPTVNSSPEIERVKEKIKKGVKCLVLLRGLPGSGKSTLARELESGGCILTTDDYFVRGDGLYIYDQTKLSDGHEWNKKRAIMAMEENFSPVIIDNTNCQAWEMKPYIKLAMNYGYDADILEPNTEWKFSVKELERLNTHKVPKEKLKKMKEKYQHNLTIDSILGYKFVKNPEVKKSTSQNQTGNGPRDEDFPALPQKRPNKSNSFSPTVSSRKDSLENEISWESDPNSTHIRRNDMRSENRYSPISGSVVRPGMVMSPVNLHKQLEMISARKMLMSPPVSLPTNNVSKSQPEDYSSVTQQSKLIPPSTTANITPASQKHNEIEAMVNDLIKDQIGNSLNKDFDCKKATEELKAFLHIMPIEPENRTLVEAVVEKKMNELATGNANISNTGGEKSSKDFEKGKSDAFIENEDRSESKNYQELDKEGKFCMTSTRNVPLSESRSSNDSELDLEKIENSAIINDIEDSVSSLAGQLDRIDKASECENNEQSNFHSFNYGIDIEGGKPQRQKRVRTHSQSRSDTNSKDMNFYSSTPLLSQSFSGSQDICEMNQKDLSMTSNSAMIKMHDSEAKYWEKSDIKETGYVQNEVSEICSQNDMWNDPKPKREKSKRKGSRENSDFEGNNDRTSKSNQDITVQKLLSENSGDVKAIIDEDLEGEDLGQNFQDKKEQGLDIQIPCPQKDEHSYLLNKLNIETESLNIEGMMDRLSKSASVSPKNDLELGISTSQSAESTPKKKSKNNKRKMAANLPFLNDDTVQLLNSGEWGSFNVRATSPEKVKLPALKIHVKLEIKDALTQVTLDDFRLLNLVENGIGLSPSDVENYSSVLCSHSCQRGFLRESSLTSSENSSAPQSPSINSVLTIDRGTQTEDLDSNSEENIEFLRQGFPNISPNDLEDILQQCDNDVQWASDLILDWKYNLSLSEEDSQKFVEALRKVVPKSPVNFDHPPLPAPKSEPLRNSKSPRLLPLASKSHLLRQSSSGLKQPSSLLDICVNYLDREKIVQKEDLERQLIISAQLWLNSMEKNMEESDRISRQHSFVEDTQGNDDEMDEKGLLELLAIAEQEMQNFNETADEFWKMPMENDKNQISCESDVPNGDLNENELNHVQHVGQVSRQDSTNEIGYKYTVPVNTEIQPARQEITRTHSNSREITLDQIADTVNDMGRSDMDSPPGFTLPLDIPRDLTLALISLFGPVSKECAYNAEKVQIQIDYNTARALHHCLHSAEEIQPIDLKQLRADEEMARKLQSEMDGLNKASLEPSLSPIKPWSQHSIPNIPTSSTVSLEKIMKEQLDIERRRKELGPIDGSNLSSSRENDDINATGSQVMIATRMKRKKLYEEFPGIDESVIDDIFQANCFSYEDTSKAIRSCLFEDCSPPQTVHSDVDAKAYTNTLIEAAKQQSLSEMLNSCLYQSGFQNAENPEYGDIRGEANVHYRLRHECFQKAQEAHRRGMGEVASFYAQQGHLHTKKIKEANMRAAEKILTHRNKFLENNSTIDLHGLYVDEAQTILKKVLSQREQELRLNPDKRKRQLFIITGRGNHSRGGIARLKPAVINFLKQSQYRFTQVHQGMLKVQL